MMHALALVLAVACTPGTPTTAAPPRPRTPVVRTRVVLTDLWVIYSINALGDPDSVVVNTTATGQPSVRRRYLSTSLTDSVKFVRPAPGATLTGTVTAISYKGKQPPSPPGTASWTYTEPAPLPPPTVDVQIRPASFTVAPDVAGACARWQEANPSLSVWVSADSVNRRAVPTCMGEAYDTVPARPMVAQFCALAIGGDSTVQVACPCAGHPYAASYCDRWLTTYQRNHPNLRAIRG